jgi:hypothetical protein
MFHKGTRVNTPRGFGKVVAHCIENDQVTFYSVELEKDASQTYVKAKEVTLSPEALELVQEYISDMEVLEDLAGNDDVTKNTCPACAGAGHFENRLETATGYTVTHVNCFLCEGAKVVAAEAFARYARMRQQVTQ